MNTCGACGLANQTSRFCTGCGAPVAPPPPTPAQAADPVVVPQPSAAAETATAVHTAPTAAKSRWWVPAAIGAGVFVLGAGGVMLFAGGGSSEPSQPAAASEPAPPPEPAPTPTATVTVTATATAPAVPAPPVEPYVEDPATFVQNLYYDWSARDQASVRAKVSSGYWDAFPNSLLDGQSIVSVESYNNSVQSTGPSQSQVCGNQRFVKAGGSTQIEYRCFSLSANGYGSWLITWTGSQATVSEWN